MTCREMFGDAKWVSPSAECKTPFIRGHFTAKKGEKAVITVCGLGFFELYINGKRASDDLFVPANSDYHFYEQQHCYTAHGELTAHRIYCLKYDVSQLIEDGQNTVAAFLAPGWYAPYGAVKLCYKIDFSQSACAVSDERCRWSQSFITEYDFIHGETHDYTAVDCADTWASPDFDDSGWRQTAVVPAPESRFFVQDIPGDRVIRHIKPRLIRHADGIKLYDLGENITGRPIVHCASAKSEKITISVGEALDSDSNADEFYIHGQTSTFITDGKERSMGIRFCWNAFRYAAVTENAQITDCEVIHSDIAVTSAFECDNEVLNWLYDAFIRTQLDNMHAGIPSDCPHLEKRGYTGDGQLCCQAVMTMFDAKAFYKKWMRDISDCQDRNTGHIQYTAPYVHSGGGPGGWGCAIIELPYQYYRAYGDAEPLREYYPQMLRYLDFLEAHSENDLVISDMPDEWSLGDWCPPSLEMQKRPAIPEPYVNNYFYVKSLRRLIEIAEIIGEQADIAAFDKTMKIKKEALINNFFDAKTGDFCKNIEGANAFAVDIGIGDERTKKHMLENYGERKLFDTGIFGTEIVTRLLFENGNADIALSLLCAEELPSFGHWKKAGATTLWEEWCNPRSMNHPMFGAAVTSLFSGVLGICPVQAGGKKFVIKPTLGNKLGFAKGFITAESGKIEVSLRRNADGEAVEITLENEVEAELWKNGQKIALHKGTNSFIF